MSATPAMSGLSWLGVEQTPSEPSSLTPSHAHPEPKRVAAALANASLNASKPPKLELMASPRSPAGAPPALGPRIVQNSEWL